MEKLVTVANCNNRLEAEMIKSKLDSAGISALVSADDVGGLFGFVFTPSVAGGAQVLVNESDASSAQQVIDSVAS